MAEIKLRRKIIYSGEVFASLVDRGWSMTEAGNFLRNIREADAVEVVYGRWEDGICTMCGYPIPTDSKCDFIDEDDCLFCYHCGAKMKGENEDG